MGSLFINLNSTEINWLWLTITWILLFALSVVAICLKVEIKNKQRISTDKTGTFGTVNTLEFYDDKVVIRNESLNSTGELKYSQFYELLESSDYFIFYLNMNQASLIRKMDVDNIEDFKLFIKSKFANNYKCMA
ncbi:MAG TPA: YcxB family protein [Clostridiales bacterium]|nr:YcxB family protein [Clostridiales bacterium]